MLSESRIVELEYALSEIEWDVVGISEIRRNWESVGERKSGNLLFHSEAKESMFGSGFLINKRRSKNIKEFRAISERIALLKIEIHGEVVMIIQTHLPTTNHKDEEISEMYDKIDKLIWEGEQEKVDVWVIGDFNACIGRRKREEGSFIGNYFHGNRNSRGEQLAKFAVRNRLKIMNSFYQKDPERKWTWISPSGKKFELDYMLTKDSRSVKDCQVVDLKFSTDHRMVVCKIKKCKNRPFNHTNEVKKAINLSAFAEALIQHANKIKISNDESVQEIYNVLENSVKLAMREAGNRSSNLRSTRNNAKITPKTRDLIRKREELNRIINKSTKQKIEHAELRKLAKREIRNDLKNHEEKTINAILSDTGSTKLIKKELSTTRKTWIQKLEFNQKVITDRSEIAQAATKFYEELYSSKRPEIVNQENQEPVIAGDQQQPMDVQECEVDKISEHEILEAVKKLKKGKASGPDGISNEILKIAIEIMKSKWSMVFTKVLSTGQVPEQWKENDIILLHKKGRKDIISNYRPITLSSCIYKLFASIIAKRISPKINQNQAESQAGFRAGYSTTDHLHSLNQIIEKHNGHGKNLYIAFVDFEKAFDSLEHDSIWKALEADQVDKVYINLLRNIYRGNKAKIRLDVDGPVFEIKRGVKQGCPLSSFLFNSVLEHAIKEINWINKGIYIGNKLLSNLRFADDVALLARNAKDLNDMLKDLESKCLEKGLRINIKKTVVMTNGPKLSITLNGAQLEYTNEAVYLGQLISFDQKTSHEIERRITKCWSKFWSLRKILKGSTSIKMKGKVIEKCILPVLLYGCQTWAPTQRDYSRLDSTQMQLLRSTCGISRLQKIRNKVIRSKFGGQELASQKAKKLKWRWAGHVGRMDEERWAKRTTAWTPQESKKRGRQRKKWDDFIIDVAGRSWMDKTKDRTGWSEMETQFEEL